MRLRRTRSLCLGALPLLYPAALCRLRLCKQRPRPAVRLAAQLVFPAFSAFFAGNLRFWVGVTVIFGAFCWQPLSLDGGSPHFSPFLPATPGFGWGIPTFLAFFAGNPYRWTEVPCNFGLFCGQPLSIIFRRRRGWRRRCGCGRRFRGRRQLPDRREAHVRRREAWHR